MKIGKIKNIGIKKNQTYTSKPFDLTYSDGALKMYFEVPPKYKNPSLIVSSELGIKKNIWITEAEHNPISIKSNYTEVGTYVPPARYIRFVIKNTGTKKVIISKLEVSDSIEEWANE